MLSSPILLLHIGGGGISELAGGVTRNIVCLFREPDAGNLPVRFDEREQETELRQTGLRRVTRKRPNSHREAKVTAPVLDSTLYYAHPSPQHTDALWGEQTALTCAVA